MKDKKNLNYGGVTWHVFINLLLGLALLVVAVYGGLTFNPIIYMLSLPSPYFILKAIKWRAGKFLEEKLRIREEIIKLVQPKEGEKVLDVGTGGGLLAIGFAKAAKNVEAVGIDLWIPEGGGTSLKTAKRNAEIEGVADRVDFKKADARRIPYPNNFFDVVVASFVLHMIYKNRDSAFKEMIRILKPKGRFTIIEPPKAFKWKINGNLKRKLEDFGLKNVKFTPIKINYPKKRNVYAIYGEKK
ncbi:class I SAM-dependent methyltransferase [Candidatus Bathyarchaeota archaeon]|nr:MAG: class I SAM-dependent methyltransferase [Candidatus Bathyarchaeota archaeon]